MKNHFPTTAARLSGLRSSLLCAPWIMHASDRQRLVAVVFLAAVCLVRGQSDLRERLAPEDFEKAGLSKLTEEELAHLSTLVAAWAVDESVALAGKRQDRLPSGVDGFGMETMAERVAEIFQAGSPEAIESRIAGTFSGWRGKTVFRLENGQVWRQAERGDFYIRVEDPKVIIRRAALGSYLLQIDGYHSHVRVRRVR